MSTLALVNAAELLPVLPSEGTLLERLLTDQHELSAVEHFARRSRNELTEPSQAKYYRDLLPASPPGPGQQYAFEVDLDSCSGCKACVVACHNLNGLEEDETWRAVGLLHGGTTQFPVLQHVTTACHHCLEPACLEGCPVEAYEKDPQTGIVRHLDDQCIGCQYCILKCPYDVPKYSRSKGIVRKCDMCSSRLAVGEAPACVQACPSQAIRISIVSRELVAENAEANLFLPGAPEPGYTLPTTTYKTRKPLPTNLLPADYYSGSPQHAHWPLVLMLVLTQMSVGAFLVEQVLTGATHSPDGSATRTLHLAVAFVLGMIGLNASVFHLGRPWLAFRAVIGWRKSWLSREVLAFGMFAGLASLYAAIPWLSPMGFNPSPAVERLLGATVVLTGVAGVACSAMIYASTRRPFWNAAYSGTKFLLTCLVLGIPVALLVQLAAAAMATATPPRVLVLWLSLALMMATLAKLVAEAAIFAWLKTRTFTPLRRTALLMTGDLARTTFIRFLLGVLGGLVVPTFLVLRHDSFDYGLALADTSLVLVLTFCGEVLERYLFFAAVVAPKMPGAPAA